MATIAPLLLEFNGIIRLMRDGQDGPFHITPIGTNMHLDQHIVDTMRLPSNTKRKQVAMTVGANLIFLRASNPVTINYGTSIEGYETTLFLVKGSFPQGILVSTTEDTELQIIVAKEV